MTRGNSNDPPDLEGYLLAARIAHTVELRKGGGSHAQKQLTVFEGGLGVVAKLADGGDFPRMVRAEVAAWRLAQELGWTDLVPTTVLRTVPSFFTGEDVEASLQIALPFFQPAFETASTVQSCSDDDSQRVAIFDALAVNADRNDGNWGFIERLAVPKLIDHGHAFEAQQGGPSVFVTHWKDAPISDAHLDRVEQFVAHAGESRLREVLDDEVVGRIVERGRSFVENRTI